MTPEEVRNAERRRRDREYKRRYRASLTPEEKAEFNRRHVEHQRVHAERHPERIVARNAVLKAVAKGKRLGATESDPDNGILVRPEVCSSCDRHRDECGRIEGAHEDYAPDKHLVVDWLCRLCHGRWDDGYKQPADRRPPQPPLRSIE